MRRRPSSTTGRQTMATPQETAKRKTIALVAALIGVLGVNGVVLLACIWMLVVYMKGPAAAPAPGPSSPTMAEAPPTETPKTSPAPGKPPITPSPIVLAAGKGGVAPLAAGPIKPAAFDGASPAAAKPVAQATENSAVNGAIDRGVAFLRDRPGPGGAGGGMGAGLVAQHHAGAQSLVGLTLLHCGASADDPAIAKIATEIRQQGANLSKTYDLALCVMFLDRLGDKGDKDLIRTMALQLVAAQGQGGGWGYTARTLNPDERSQLLSHLESGKASPDPKKG